MGSVLRRGGQQGRDGRGEAVWDPAPGMARNLLRPGSWIDELVLDDHDDPANPGFLDGLVPDGLARSTSIVPGLVEIDGYDELHDALRAAFGSELIEGDPLRPLSRLDGRDGRRLGHPNYYRFAYDWRRDLRAAALRLHNLIEAALPALQAQRDPDARVIFIAHSMGGLLARAYIEGDNPDTGRPFDGWRNVRELLTLGTPHRGSVAAVGHLVDGYRRLFVDFSRALRSFTGVYQLLPRYPVVFDARPDAPGTGHTGGLGEPVRRWLYPHEIDGVDGFDPVRAQLAYEFHRSIEDGVNRNRTNPQYRANHLVPLLGFGHRTLNSATYDGTITVSDALPDYLDPVLGGGDGTVPLVSAIPIELDDNRSTIRYVNQKHGALQTDRRVLAAEIAGRIRQLQASSEAARFRQTGAGIGPEQAHLEVTHAQFWVDSDLDGVAGAAAELGSATPGALTPTVVNGDDGARLTVEVTNLETGSVTRWTDIESGRTVELPGDPGDYRVVVNCPAVPLSSTSAYTVLPSPDDLAPTEPGTTPAEADR
jgi:hypothetical protein